MLMAVVPLLVINIGWKVKNERAYRRAGVAQEEQARQLLAALGETWRFHRQLVRFHGQLHQKLGEPLGFINPPADHNQATGTPTDTAGEARPDLLPAVARAVLQPPFPAHELWVFRLPQDRLAGSVAPELLLGPERSRTGRRSMATAFAHLVLESERRATGAERQRGQKLIDSLFGGQIPIELLARTQCGVPTRIVYTNRFHWLIWDVWRDRAGRPLGGYFLLTPDNATTTVVGLRLARRQLADSLAAGLSGSSTHGTAGLAGRPGNPAGLPLTGFVQLVGRPRCDVLASAFARSPTFRRWLADFRRQLANRKDGLPFEQIERDGVPWGKRLGQYRVFTWYIPDARHLALIALPIIPQQPLAPGIIALDVLAALLLFLLASRHAVAGRPMRIGLSWRFAGLFVVASALPIGLGLIAARVTLEEHEATLLANMQARLTAEIGAIEHRRNQLQENYLAAFGRTLADPELLAALQIGPHRQRASVCDRLTWHFRTASPALSVAAICLYDSNGQYIATGSNEIQFDDVRPMVRFYRSSMTRTLRHMMLNHDPTVRLPPDPLSTEDRALLAAYEESCGSDAISSLLATCGMPELMRVGRSQTVKLHDFITVAGRPRFSLVVVWQQNDLDRSAMQTTSGHLRATQPDLDFVAFRRVRGQLEPVSGGTRLTRHLLDATANTASVRQGSVFVVDEARQYVSIAQPSREMNDMILAMGTPLTPVTQDLAQMARHLWLSLVVSLGIMIVLGLWMGTRIVTPIAKLKAALDAVAVGDLDQSIDLARPDELGQLTCAFTEMIAGLRTRRRLAALVSGKALDAIASTRDLAHLGAGHRLEAVVLVSDIRDFTTHCEHHPPAVMTALLNQHYTRMDAIISAHGGRVDKFIGDAIQAIFEPSGPDAGLEQTARAACRAGHAMLHELARINAARTARREFPYAIGIGIAAGSLVVGGIGSPTSRLDFTMVGEPVKEATRLEAASKQCPSWPLVISRTVADLAGVDPADLTTIAAPMAALAVAPDIAGTTEPGARASQETYTSNTTTRWSMPGNAEPASPHRAPEPGAPRANARDAGFTTQPTTPVARHHTATFRFALFLAGFLLLTTPAIVVWRSLASADMAQHQVLQREADERNRAALRLVKAQDFAESLIDQRMREFAEEIARRVASSGPSLTREKLGLTGSETLLAGDRSNSAIRPVAVAVVRPRHDRWAAPAEVCMVGVASADARDLGRLVAYLADWSANVLPSWEVSETERSLQSFVNTQLGMNLPVRDLTARNRGHCRAGFLSGRPVWWFWQTLAITDPQAVTTTILSQAAQEGVTPRIAPILTQIPKVIGAAMIAIPREPITARRKAHMLMANYDDGDTALVLLSPDGNERYPSPQWGHGALARWLTTADFANPPSGWVIASDQVTLGNPYRVIAATRRAEPQTVFGLSPGTARALNLAALGGTLLAAVILWILTVYFDAGIAVSLSRQLWFGFLLAALLPLATTFALAATLIQEHRDTTVREVRTAMRNKIDDAHRRKTAYRAWLVENLFNLARSPKMLAVARRVHQQAMASGKNASAANDRLLATFDALAHHVYRRPIVKISFSSSVLVGPHGFRRSYRYAGMRGHVGNSDQLAESLSFIGGSRLLLLNPDLPHRDDARTLTETTKQELTTSAGLDIMRSIYGPDLFFHLLAGWHEPMRMVSSVGMTFIAPILSPSEQKPEYLFIWIFAVSMPDWHAILRVANAQSGTHPFFTSRLDYLGEPPTPRGSVALPTIGAVAQLTALINAPVSLRISEVNTRYLAESVLDPHGQQLVTVGISPEIPIDEASRRLAQTFNLLLSLALLATVLLAMSASRDLLAPIEALGEGMRAIDAARYDHRLPEERADELGDLCRTFNQMARGLEERELLGRMVSASARKAVLSDADADRSRTGESRDLTVLFLGVPGFAHICATADPVTLIANLNRQAGVICSEIERAGGDVDKMIGDKILAVFHHLNSSPAAATQGALDAGQRLLAAAARGDMPYPVALGIHAGPVLIGLLGAGDRQDHTVIGDTVNTAARVEALAEDLHQEPRLIMTSTACDLLGAAAPPSRPLAVTAVKGKRRAVQLFQPIGTVRGDA